MARPALDPLHGLVDAQLGIHLQEHMDMIGHDLHLDDLEMEVICHLPGYLLEALVHPVHKNRSAIFRAEDHMVLAAVDDVVVASVLHEQSIPRASV